MVATLDPALTGHTDASGCAGIEKSVLQDLQTNPQFYSLEARNDEFPNGAIRGQLA